MTTGACSLLSPARQVVVHDDEVHVGGRRLFRCRRREFVEQDGGFTGDDVIWSINGRDEAGRVLLTMRPGPELRRTLVR
jgi:hypothetical protein